MIIESRERRRVEKSHVPRTAKKVSRTRMEGEMGKLGLDMDNMDQVSISVRLSVCVLSE